MTDQKDNSGYTVNWQGQSLTQKEFEDYTSQSLPLQIKSKLEASRSLFEFDSYADDIRKAISGIDDVKLKKICHSLIDAQRVSLKLKLKGKQDSITLQRRKVEQGTVNPVEPILNPKKNNKIESIKNDLGNKKKVVDKVTRLLQLIKEDEFMLDESFQITPFLAWWSVELFDDEKKLPNSYGSLCTRMPNAKFKKR